MRKMLKQGISGYYMPLYVQEILTNQYCGHFLGMNVVREKENYLFSYETGRYRKMDFSRLTLLDKLILIRSLYEIIDESEDYLIRSDIYLLEPELIYAIDNSTDADMIRILFYPDTNNLPFERKMISFIERIKDKRDDDEIEVLGQLQKILEEDDYVRELRFLDKNIFRMQSNL